MCYLFPFFIPTSIYVNNIIKRINKGKVPTNLSTFTGIITIFVYTAKSFPVLRPLHIFTSLLTYHLPVFHRLGHPQRIVRYPPQT